MEIAPRLPHAPGLHLDAFAEAAAGLLHARGARPADVLEALGVTEGRWTACAAAWDSAIEDEIAHGEHALLLAFAARLAEARERLAGRSARAPVEPAFEPPPSDAAERTLASRRDPALLRPEAAAFHPLAFTERLRPADPAAPRAVPARAARATPLLPPPLPPPPPLVPHVPLAQDTVRLDGALARRVSPSDPDDPAFAPAFPLTRVKRAPPEARGLRGWLARLFRRLAAWRSSR